MKLLEFSKNKGFALDAEINAFSEDGVLNFTGVEKSFIANFLARNGEVADRNLEVLII